MSLVPKVHIERCTRFRFRYSECGRCAEACPHGALELSEEGVSLAAAKCRHCALCLSACPTEAFESPECSASAITRSAGEAKAWTIACASSGAAGDATVPCLGALDSSSVSFLLSRAVRLTLSGAAHCARCAHGAKGNAAVDALVTAVAHLRQEIGDDRWAELVVTGGKGQAVDRAGAGRRQFFRRLVAGGAAQLMAAEGEPVAIPAKAVRPAAPCRPTGNRLLEGMIGNRTLATLPNLAVGRAVAAAGGCTGCELCERVCPTGALRTSESGGVWELEFHGHCVGCGVCVEACEPGALALAGEVGGTGEYPPLHVLSRTRCTGCGRIHVGTGADTPCPVCADDDQNIAAIFG